MDETTIGLIVTAVVAIASALSAVMPDKFGAVSKFLNMLALNVGKAKNDPAAQ